MIARLRAHTRPLAVLALATLATTGCFHYAPVDTLPPRGSAVQVHLARPIPVPLQDITANNVVLIRGEMITEQTERVALSAFTLKSATDFEYLAGGQTVFVPRDALARIEKKQLSVVRSAIAAVTLVGLGILVDWGLRQASGSGNGPDGRPPIE